MPDLATRILSQNFEGALIQGVLKPVLDLLHADRDLNAQIRSDRLDVYCKGNRLVSVSPFGNAWLLESNEAFWSSKRLIVDTQSEAAEFCNQQVPFIKQKIAMHSAKGKEVEFEQMPIRACNIERLSSDYICVDRQGVLGGGAFRTDISGVFWPATQRRQLSKLDPVLVEVKYALGGGVSDIAQQVNDYYNFITPNIESFSVALEAQLHQIARLKLLSGLSSGAQEKIARLPVSRSLHDFRIVVALIDCNPRSALFNLERLRELPFAAQIDLFHLGLSMWQENRLAIADVQPVLAPTLEEALGDAGDVLSD